MRQFLILVLLIPFCLQYEPLHAQTADESPTHLFRIYEDDDFMNVTGNGTDDAYTNGLQFDLLYMKQRRSRFIDRLLPTAGKGSVNIFGWSITQLMFTPDDITTTEYQPNDYPYAGALFVTHSLYSYNTAKKYSFQTELIGGVRGPASFAKELQTWVHAVINYDEPRGWDNQLRTSPLLNLNFSAEKQLLAVGNWMEVIGGARINAGTYVDAFSIYPLIRIGKMAPYFDGYFSRYGSYYRNGRKMKTQYYLMVKAENTFVAHDALLYGKRVNEQSVPSPDGEPMRTIRHRLADIQFGAVVAHGNFAASFSQTHSSEYNQGLYHHSWGNVSVYYRW